MSLKLFNAVNEFARQQGKAAGLLRSDMAVLHQLAYHHNDDTGECFPSEATLAAETLCSKSTIIRSADRLEQLGLIVRSVRKTRNGNGRNYELHIPDISAPEGSRAHPSADVVGSTVHPSRSHGASQLVASRESVGSTLPPDTKEISSDSECDRAAHTQESVGNSRTADTSGSSPFGIYDVEDAMRQLSHGDDPVPRAFIEKRAKALAENHGKTDRSDLILSDRFIAHCRKWWDCEHDKTRYLVPASAPQIMKTKNRIPLAAHGENQKAGLCDECGCEYCTDGHVCAKGYIPPDIRVDDPCRPDEKLSDGSYRCGCFSPRK